MNAPSNSSAWRNWVVKVIVAANISFILVLFELPSSALPYRWLDWAIDIWFLASPILIAVLFVTALVRKLGRGARPAPGWISLAVDGLLVLGWWATAAYLLLRLLLAGAAAVPAG